MILYFCLRGNIETEEKRWWKIHLHRQPKSRMTSNGAQATGQVSQEVDRPQGSKGAAKEAFMMLL
jgi:hypothetical protein